MKRHVATGAAIIILVPALLYGAPKLADIAYRYGEYKTALWVYRPFANMGVNRYQKLMARMYLDGRGVEQSYEKAADWFHGPAEDGDAQAQAVLGVLYMADVLGTRDLKKSFEWFYRSANGGNHNAQSFVAIAYANGEGVEADRIQAYKWLLIMFGGDLPDAYKKRMMSLKEMKPLFDLITSPEIAKAQIEAREWVANFRKKR